MKKIFFLLLIIYFFTACKKNNKPEDPSPPQTATGKNTLNNNAFIVDTSAVLASTDNSVTILKSATTLRLKVGEILLSAPNRNATYGFMRKIVAISENNSQINYTTTQASLNETFKELHINATFNDSITSTQSGRLATIGDANLNFNFLSNTTFFPGLKLNGNLSIKFSSIDFKYDKEPGSLLPKYALIKAQMTTDGSLLSLSTTGSLAINTPEVTYANFWLPDFYIPVPIPFTPLTFPMRCAQRALIKGGPISFSGKAKWVILPKVNATIGVKYENGSWTSLNSFSVDASTVPLSQFDFNPSVSLDANFVLLKPVYEISPFGADIIKAYLEAPAELSFTGQPITPNYSLKFKASITAGMGSTFFYDGQSRSVNFTAPIIEKTLLEGNWTDAVTIGTKTWMKKNLDVTTYRNGDPIPQVTDPSQWANLTTGAWCYYNNDPSTNDTYGKLYNWYAINDSRGLAPSGWNIPSHSDWTGLITLLGGESVAGGKMKAVSNLWVSPNVGADNSTGFSALPGGYRDQSGNFSSQGYSCYLFSTSTGVSPGNYWCVLMHNNSSSLFQSNVSAKTGLPVRCFRY